jgi:O-6-methylguanine DNA methyltransferase
MTKDDLEPLFELVIPTVHGEFTARYSACGLAGLAFPPPAPCHRRAIPHELLRQISQWHRLTTRALKLVLAGEEPLELPPLDLAAGTAFQRQVWRALQRIPRGKTSSYGAVARRIGRPKSVRAVGGACGANPLPVLIPCHRVLAANGRLGGFSGGLPWKRRLLEAEGFVPAAGSQTA